MVTKKTLGKYEVVERLGRGGMAEVYRGYHAALDRYVAIKLLHPFLADDPEFKERFEREARHIARLRHPNIVQVFDFDFDEEGESYYMVMELINGPTLKDLLFKLSSEGEQLPLERTIQIIKDAGEALAYAHRRNMIHRDVKPANLMIDEDERVVLTDFGIARILTGSQFTATGGMVGTPAYMSPEQGLGESGDERSDIYSLGVILYQMVTNQLPFDADTPLAIILKHLNDPLPSPLEFNANIPSWVVGIITKSLEKEAEDRYQNAEEMIADLVAGPSAPARVTPPKSSKPSPKAAPASHMGLLDDTPTIKAAPETLESAEQAGRRTGFLMGAIAGLIVTILLLIGVIMGQDGSGPLAGLFDNNTATEEVTAIPLETETQEMTIAETEVATEPPAATETEAIVTEIAAATEVVTEETPDIIESSPTDTETPEPATEETVISLPTETATATPITPTATEDTVATATAVQAQQDSMEAQQVQTAEAMTLEAQTSFFATQRAITPTVDTKKALVECDLEYSIISPEDLNKPPSVNQTQHPRLIPNGENWSLSIEFQNTSTCRWPAGKVYLSFVENANPDVTLLDDDCVSDNRLFKDVNLTRSEIANILLEEAVEPGERFTVTLDAQAPTRYGCYFSTWELRIPEYDLYIGDEFTIGYTIFGGN